jgi:rare lipoprotein A
LLRFPSGYGRAVVLGRSRTALRFKAALVTSCAETHPGAVLLSQTADGFSAMSVLPPIMLTEAPGTYPDGWRSISMVMCRLSLAAVLLVLALGSVHAETGIAAFYGGGRTSSGEVSGPNGLTAAHRTLPFGTKVLVTNVRNGRTVLVRINDRGPYGRGRIIDLSRAAARELDMIRVGTTQVSVVRQ